MVSCYLQEKLPFYNSEATGESPVASLPSLVIQIRLNYVKLA